MPNLPSRHTKTFFANRRRESYVTLYIDNPDARLWYRRGPALRGSFTTQGALDPEYGTFAFTLSPGEEQGIFELSFAVLNNDIQAGDVVVDGDLGVVGADAPKIWLVHSVTLSASRERSALILRGTTPFGIVGSTRELVGVAELVDDSFSPAPRADDAVDHSDEAAIYDRGNIDYARYLVPRALPQMALPDSPVALRQLLAEHASSPHYHTAQALADALDALLGVEWRTGGGSVGVIDAQSVPDADDASGQAFYRVDGQLWFRVTTSTTTAAGNPFLDAMLTVEGNAGSDIRDANEFTGFVRQGGTEVQFSPGADIGAFGALTPDIAEIKAIYETEIYGQDGLANVNFVMDSTLQDSLPDEGGWRLQLYDNNTDALLFTYVFGDDTTSKPLAVICGP